MKKFISLLFAALILSSSYASAEVVAEEPTQESPAGDENQETETVASELE